ncbi:hypothetical protein [Shimia marina]|uniref:Uncharacterized protein n=1 Tax=Shimia marina TaxID=321267 RepID=A0A0P1FDU3_9RHOB|nr:hypothetical protein [Shimia marina]CUH54283.1 hypothetical protein SHM7688_03753 [Shimia marina]SFD99409.1 hypothetical protein SAMN04488037_104162 [Shimia marina]
MRRLSLLLCALPVAACQTSVEPMEDSKAAKVASASSIQSVTMAEGFSFFEKYCVASFPEFEAAKAKVAELRAKSGKSPESNARRVSGYVSGKHLYLDVEQVSETRSTCAVRWGTQDSLDEMLAEETASIGKPINAFGNDFRGTGIPVDYSGWSTPRLSEKAPGVDFLILEVTAISKN